MIGYLGEIVFETSDRKILNFTDLKMSLSPRWGRHEPVMSIPQAEFIGPGYKTVTFTMNLNVNNNISPRVQYEKLLNLTNKGEVLPFFLGERPVGNFVITNLDINPKTIDNRGGIWNGSVSISLEEYGDEPTTVRN